jgi:hypothetical protein
MENKSINFDKFMSLKPYEYSEFKNSIGQLITFAEHPIKGDSAPIMAIFKEEKKVYCTDFYELGEMDEVNGEYEILLIKNIIQYGK